MSSIFYFHASHLLNMKLEFVLLVMFKKLIILHLTFFCSYNFKKVNLFDIELSNILLLLCFRFYLYIGVTAIT